MPAARGDLPDLEAFENLADWMAHACVRLAELSGATGTTLWTWDAAADALQIVASYRMDADWIGYGNQCARLDVAKERAPVYTSYHTGADVSLADPMADPKFRYFTEAYQDAPIRHIHAVPLGLGARRVGAAALYFTDPVTLD